MSKILRTSRTTKHWLCKMQTKLLVLYIKENKSSKNGDALMQIYTGN